MKNKRKNMTKKYKNKTKKYKNKKHKTRKYNFAGYNHPNDINTVRLLLRSKKIPGHLADIIAMEGVSRLPPNLSNQLQARARDLRNKYDLYAHKVKFNKRLFDQARIRFPQHFLPDAIPMPIRQTGYSWFPKGEIDSSGRPVMPGYDRMAREFI